MSQNIIDANGLQLKTLNDIITEILNGTEFYPGFYQIYGADINVEPNSPDGQMIHIFAQSVIDVEELLAQIYSSFDPDQAIGVALDARCAINGVTRRAGTYTQVPILVTVNQAVTLAGLDTAQTNPFTVADAAGNQYQLVNTVIFNAAGAATLTFQAATLGAVQSIVNTINQIVTATLGVVSVNNPNPALVVGTNQETDVALRVRRANSVALPSKGYLQGLYGALLNTDGVLEARVLENNTDVVDGNGIPGHSIWCIVSGGSDYNVANTIYVKRNAGCGMKGTVVVQVVQVDNTTIPIKFDRPTAQPLWIKFTATAVTGVVDAVYLRNQILALLKYTIGQPADASAIIALCKQIAPNLSFSAEGVSGDNITYVSLLNPTGVNYQFQLAAARIIINGVPG